MVIKKGKKKKRTWDFRVHVILCVLVFLLSSFFIYYFSFDSKAHILAVSGNYYLKDQEVYQLAHVDTETRLWLTPSVILKNRVYKNPLIDTVQVKKEKGKLLFKIKEKTIIGYYVKDNKNYCMTIDGESIELDSKYLKIITHFPLFSNFSEKQMKQICKEFKKNESQLTRQLIEKIAEIVPFETSYDKNMIQMTMQDGNVVYTSIDSLVMMANYQAMLTQLKGQSVCLVLDAKHSTIEKINCEDILTPHEEEKEEPKEEKIEEPIVEEPVQEPEVQEVYDWEYIQEMGMEYSPSLGLYRDPNTEEPYIYDEEQGIFVPYTQ